MSDTDGRRRPGSGDDDSRPLTAAGRRRRETSGDDPAGRAAARGAASRAGGATTAAKGSSTPSRDGGAPAGTGNPVARLRRFLREVVAELRKVHWPTRRQIVVYTAVVLVFVSFIVAYVAGLDALFAQGVFALFG